MTNKILLGDAPEVLKTLESGSVHMCVTSPPYWGLRDYGVDGQIGLECTKRRRENWSDSSRSQKLLREKGIQSQGQDNPAKHRERKGVEMTDERNSR